MGTRCLSRALLLCSALAIWTACLYADRAEARSAWPEGQVVTPQSSIARPEDVGIRAHSTINLFIPSGGPESIAPPSPSRTVAPAELPPLSGLYSWNTPASLACAYRLVPRQDESCNPYIVTRNPSGGSRAIAIVDAFDAPNAASDLAVFSAQFGLPPADFHKIYASAGSCTSGGTQPAYDAGWESEESLSIEWAHAMAPGARIYLVEAASGDLADLLAAVLWPTNACPRTGVAKSR